ncbi:hypothetical protein BJY04DRAFT_212810 [Aspergillus karnatakaensis]|uniref:putative quinol monooxygenase n=1 Tax=Aspergillus karnatakaensis TaxID=1810916 RepID=UPI003CCE3363
MAFHGTSIHMTVFIKPETVERFWDLFRPVLAKIKEEPDLLFFEAYQSPDEPGVISWVENWSKPKDWLLANQVNKPYYNEYRALTGEFYTKPMEIKIYERVGPEFTYVKEQ